MRPWLSRPESLRASSSSLNTGHLLCLRIAFHSGCRRMGLGLCYFSHYSSCCHHFHCYVGVPLDITLVGCFRIRLNFNDMWRPGFRILFVQRQLYLSRSG
nr:transmembrane protein 244 isoform X2 [Mirounga angustirostris]